VGKPTAERRPRAARPRAWPAALQPSRAATRWAARPWALQAPLVQTRNAACRSSALRPILIVRRPSGAASSACLNATALEPAEPIASQPRIPASRACKTRNARTRRRIVRRRSASAWSASRPITAAATTSPATDAPITAFRPAKLTPTAIRLPIRHFATRSGTSASSAWLTKTALTASRAARPTSKSARGVWQTLIVAARDDAATLTPPSASSA
jgi:hypothetical protein